MTPLKLTLKNFLSYREATLDFTGFHTACICGVNGAGKSSLLEAVTWAIWGKSRAGTADDVIHGGEMDVRVDFEFATHQQVYKIIRMRSRGKGASLQFQVRSESGQFIALTSKGMQDAQDYINQELKLDYDTFVNSAYLRQGRADDFMLATPAKRKDLLGSLLKLDQYEKLAQSAKDKAKEFKIKADLLEQNLTPKADKIAERKTIQTELDLAQQAIATLQTRQAQDQATLKDLQVIANQRHILEQQLTLQQQSLQRRQQDQSRLMADMRRSQQELTQTLTLLEQAPNIERQYQQWQTLQQQEDIFNQKFQQYQDLQQQIQTLNQQIQQQESQLQLQIQQLQLRLTHLDQQTQELQPILTEAPTIDQGLKQLITARQEVHRLDKLQHQIAPLLQQKQILENQINQTAEKIKLKLEAHQQEQVKLTAKIAQIPQQKQELAHLNQKFVELHKQKIYQDRLQTKKLEQSNQRERLQEGQRNYHKQLQELQQKLALLQTPHAICPLCEQDLDQAHREQVIAKTHHQQTATESEIWRLKEQLLQCDQDLSAYEQELNHLHTVLQKYGEYDQQMARLEAELEYNQELQKTFQQIDTEIETLRRSLTLEAYAEDLRTELASITQQLQTLQYDERSQAIARETEKQWQWAEIKHHKLEEAEKKLTKIQQEKPSLDTQLQKLQWELINLRKISPLQQQLQALERQLNALSYDRHHHQTLRQQIRASDDWQLRKKELEQAQRQQPQLTARLQELQQTATLYEQDCAQMQAQIDDIILNLNQFSDHHTEIAQLEQQIQQRRQELDRQITHQGQLQQTLQQLDHLATEYEAGKTEVKELRRQYRIYKELGNAFGKNGIQTLMIENALPQLEAETNQILSRLTGNQFHVQFLTQKPKKGSKKNSATMTDTLDILIADARGTRPYETYSGGEAFRINFSIRLALAKLLAHRSGMALQMLVIDEGFGTQDAEGCARLIAAINAIADDFACILAVTHIPQFKEAFQSRIEVFKTKQGSQILVNN